MPVSKRERQTKGEYNKPNIKTKHENNRIVATTKWKMYGTISRGGNEIYLSVSPSTFCITSGAVDDGLFKRLGGRVWCIWVFAYLFVG